MGRMERSSVKRVAGLILLFLVAAALGSCAFLKGKGKPVYNLPLNEGVTNLVLTDMEKEVVRQLNDLRTNPGQWAGHVRKLKGRGLVLDQQGMQRIDGEEAATAAEDATLFLERRKPLPPFRVSKGFCLTARDLLNDHGPKGLTGHRGSDGSSFFDRILRHGQWEGKAGENLVYGYKDADRLLIGLLTEGGSEGLEQRNNVFNKDFNLIGVACGKHNVYRTMCVIDFAEKYTEMP